eukprot:1799980-Pleurochrysis_carterae.AAC.1
MATGSPRSPPARPRQRPRRSREGALINSNYYALTIDEGINHEFPVINPPLIKNKGSRGT